MNGTKSRQVKIALCGLAALGMFAATQGCSSSGGGGTGGAGGAAPAAAAAAPARRPARVARLSMPAHRVHRWRAHGRTAHFGLFGRHGR